MMTMVAFRMESSTTADRFGGVSIKTHSKPSRFAAATMPPTEFTAVLIGGSLVPRSLCRGEAIPADLHRSADTAWLSCAHAPRDERPGYFSPSLPYAMRKR